MSDVCIICSKQLFADDIKVYYKKKYCSDCLKLKKSKSKNKSSSEKSELTTQYKNLISLICECYNVTKPTAMIFSQIQNFKSKLNMNYQEMSYVLWYVKTIKSYNFDIKYGLAIIKLEYDNAKNYGVNQNKVIMSIDNLDLKEILNKTITKNVKFNDNSVKILFDLDRL